MTGTKSGFWDDLAKDLEDPDFMREYVVESIRIATIDAVVGRLDEARDAAGLTKADLARAIGAESALPGGWLEPADKAAGVSAPASGWVFRKIASSTPLNCTALPWGVLITFGCPRTVAGYSPSPSMLCLC